MAKKNKKKKNISSGKSKKTFILPRIPNQRDIPVYDFFENINLDDSGDLEECLDMVISYMEEGYFLQWEAVVRCEQGLPLTKSQEIAYYEIISLSEDEDDPILYIDEMPRPSEPWYEIVRKIVPKLIIDPFNTDEMYNEFYYEGWPRLIECIEEYTQDLSLPEGITSPTDVIPPEIYHRLELHYGFDILSGLGQEDYLTLEDEEQAFRIEEFIDRLKECEDSVKYFDLTLETLFEMVNLPDKDQKILAESMMKQLGIKSISQKLHNFL